MWSRWRGCWTSDAAPVRPPSGSSTRGTGCSPSIDDPDVRARLIEELCELIDRAYDGKVERPYRSEAIVGVRGG